MPNCRLPREQPARHGSLFDRLRHVLWWVAAGYGFAAERSGMTGRREGFTPTPTLPTDVEWIEHSRH